MGTGASKKAKTSTESPEEDEDEDYDSFSKKRSQPLNEGQPRLEQAGLLPKLENSSSNFIQHQKRTTIVGLLDSDDEESEVITQQKAKKAAAGPAAAKAKISSKTANDEKQLRNEILELEKTFESLEMESSSAVAKRPPGLMRASTIDHHHIVQPLSYNHSRPARGPLRPQQSFTAPVSRPLKFSWEETHAPVMVDKDTDEWNYKQVINMMCNWSTI